MSPPSRETISTLSISPPLPLIVTPSTTTPSAPNPPSIKVTPAAGGEEIFSLTDEELSDAYTFVKEVGFGNWGIVWLCKRKLNNPGQKVAIKLVHRSKTPTTAARVRSLWNEMKTIRTLPRSHPSIITFESFIISPSYALVVMPYLERLMPVNITEEEARPYFRGLISAVSFLHENMITHNDIKPANVLLRDDNTPVLVDFGFATKWDEKSNEPFFSTISWGTPEYLSSSRARGMKHDERTSDVWSLGITLFEILTGRTPFEESEQEQFSSPDELQLYYDRTVAGTWVGTWEMSVGESIFSLPLSL
ncbi:kinase-like domain-containing protein [Mrakia frigida]|uniref:serine/threonine-protein kinase n=1 Tax=Mrakia frigida TaxID=29902 RepID=UPI003FCC0CA6